MTDAPNRRPLKSRQSPWARRVARGLAEAGLSPDMVSFLSLVFAVMAACALALSSQAVGGLRVATLVVAAVGVQLRLLCNLLDGMVAVEHGKGGAYGAIWNELPDRFSDVALLIGAGLAASPAAPTWGPLLGFACALLAVLTAYVRELGRALGLAADFSGPMAKPQRMALLTAAALLSVAEPLWRARGVCLFAGLVLMAVLTAVTVVRRVARLAQGLKRRSREDAVQASPTTE